MRVLVVGGGGREHAPVQFEWMKVLHTTWFVSMLVEVFALKRKFPPLLASVAVLTLAVGQSLRYAAIRTLGWRWSVRVMTLCLAAGMSTYIVLQGRRKKAAVRDRDRRQD